MYVSANRWMPPTENAFQGGLHAHEEAVELASSLLLLLDRSAGRDHCDQIFESGLKECGGWQVER